MENLSVCRQTVTVDLENGLHLVPCSQIAQAASAFPCDIRILKGDASVDAKVIYDVMSLGAELGSTLVIEAAGELAEQAVAELVGLFRTNFAA